MMRLRAVRSLLFDDVAELRLGGGRRRSFEGRAGEPVPDAPTVDDGDPALEQRQRAAIEAARGRAAQAAAVGLLAILVLFALRPRIGPFLVLAGSEEGLFSLGVLAIAVHAGYRLGQRQKLGALLRAWDSLPGRYDGAPAGRSA
jgi:hypothetical protein